MALIWTQGDRRSICGMKERISQPFPPFAYKKLSLALEHRRQGSMLNLVSHLRRADPAHPAHALFCMHFKAGTPNHREEVALSLMLNSMSVNIGARDLERALVDAALI